MQINVLVTAVVLLINGVLCISQYAVQQWELRRGRIPKRHSTIPATNQQFNHWQDAHCQTWGDMIGLGLVQVGFAHLMISDHLNSIQWAAFAGMTALGSWLWYKIGTDPGYKPNWSFPTPGKMSIGGTIHLPYFGMNLAVAILCLYHLYQGNLTGVALAVTVCGWVIFCIAVLADVLLGHKDQIGAQAPQKKPLLLDLVKTGRIRGTLYTFVLVIAGFVMYEDGYTSWLVVILCALSFATLHMSIMTFNDWRDREHDLKKGKRLAHDHQTTFWSYWVALTTVSLGSILILGYLSAPVALFCLAILLLGLAYSFTEHIPVLNNVIVATCAAAPVLCGSIYLHRNDCVLWYEIFFLLVLAREILKDMEDVHIDAGYKATLVTSLGLIPSKWISISLTVVAGVLIHLTKRAFEALAILGVLIYKFVRWDPTSIPKQMIVWYDTLLSTLVICLAVPVRYGDKQVAMLDMWSIEHLLWGIVLFAGLRHMFTRSNPRNLLIATLSVAYGWEALEFMMELGVFGQGIATWKGGLEHWSNRALADPGLVLLGALTQSKWGHAWKIVVIPWAMWGILNYISPDAMYIQNLILGLLPW